MEPILTISNLEKTIEEFHLGPMEIRVAPSQFFRVGGYHYYTINSKTAEYRRRINS